ncbi:MAG TPA: hypothetical protein VGN37_01195 [Actinocatenispora sp.]
MALRVLSWLAAASAAYCVFMGWLALLPSTPVLNAGLVLPAVLVTACTFLVSAAIAGAFRRTSRSSLPDRIRDFGWLPARLKLLAGAAALGLLLVFAHGAHGLPKGSPVVVGGRYAWRDVDGTRTPLTRSDYVRLAQKQRQMYYGVDGLFAVVAAAGLAVRRRKPGDTAG